MVRWGHLSRDGFSSGTQDTYVLVSLIPGPLVFTCPSDRTQTTLSMDPSSEVCPCAHACVYTWASGYPRTCQRPICSWFCFPSAYKQAAHIWTSEDPPISCTRLRNRLQPDRLRLCHAAAVAGRHTSHTETWLTRVNPARPRPRWSGSSWRGCSGGCLCWSCGEILTLSTENKSRNIFYILFIIIEAVVKCEQNRAKQLNSYVL